MSRDLVASFGRALRDATFRQRLATLLELVQGLLQDLEAFRREGGAAAARGAQAFEDLRARGSRS